MIPTVHYTVSPDSLRKLRKMLTTPDPEPIFTQTLNAHTDRLDLNFDADQIDALAAMKRTTDPTRTANIPH